MTREKAVQILADLIANPFLHTWEEENKALYMAIEALSERTGEWIPNHTGYWKCSKCGLRVLVYAKGNYCPNCGARMEGGDTE